jgi:hypothetical protein
MGAPRLFSGTTTKSLPSYPSKNLCALKAGIPERISEFNPVPDNRIADFYKLKLEGVERIAGVEARCGIVVTQRWHALWLPRSNEQKGTVAVEP